MTIRQENHRSPRRGPASRSGQRGRVYVFAVVALATFLVALVSVRPSPQGVIAEAVLLQEISGNLGRGKQVLEADPVAELRSLQHKFQGALQVPAASSGAQADPAVPSILTVKCNDVVESDRSTPRAARRITVRLAGRVPESTQGLLDQVVQGFAIVHTRPSPEAEIVGSRQELEAQRESWQARRVTAQLELDSYVTREIGRRRELTNTSTLTLEPAASTAASPPASPMPIVQVPNPRWQALQRKLADAEFRLAELQITYTAEHPLVIESTRTVSRLKAQLRALPTVLEMATDQNPHVRNFSKAGAPPEQPDGSEIAAKFDELQVRKEILASSECQALQAAVDAAQARCQDIDDKLKQLPKPESLFAESTIVESPARVTMTRRGAITPSFVWSLLLPSLGLGGLLAIPRSRLVLPSCLCSVQDVKLTLGGIPTSTLSTKDGPEVPLLPSNRIPTFIRRAVTASEFAILMVAILFLVCLCLIPGFSEVAKQDPLGAANSVWERLRVLTS